LTQPEPQTPKLLTDSLLDDLKDTPTVQMGPAARKAEHYTPEDDDSDKRQSKAEMRRTLRKIRQAFFWVLFILLSLFAAFAVFGFGLVLAHWVQGFWDDSAKVEAFVYGVGWTVLVALATLFVEKSIPDKD
jgi:hypothetical protein